MHSYKFIRPLESVERTLYVDAFYKRLADWRALKQELTNKQHDRALLDLWERERNRAFAIGTGEVEGLYRLKRGITEQLISEGLEAVESSHTYENVRGDTIKGLLRDQFETIEMVSGMVKDEIPLTHHTVRGLHEHVTRHQETAVGIDIRVSGTQIPLSKGVYKTQPNHPTRVDDEIHEYCPPESTHAEMTRLLDWHQEHSEQGVGVLERAAWLHYRFVQIHPFQDGNGRTARLLMAYVLIKDGAFPPLIQLGNRDDYIISLEDSDDAGSLQPFVDFVAEECSASLRSASGIARAIIRGRNHYRHPNRGVTIDGVYHGPDSEEALTLDCPIVTDSPENDSPRQT